MAGRNKLLIINVDVDNDLFEKAKVHGPVIGKAANLEAAQKLALADPEDSDVNAIFAAVKTADELSNEYDTEVVTLTGHKKLGFYADKNIVKQLETITSKYKGDSCVLVSDGASDESVLPLIQSRLKVISLKRVFVKQSKELEKTYFILLEKLKDPHYARIIFGIPGLALLFYAFSEVIGFRLFLGLLGVYLLLKGIGLEEKVIGVFSELELSFNNLGSIFYFAAIPLAAASIWLGISKVTAMQQVGITDIAKLTAGFSKDLLLLLAPAILLVLIGKVAESLNEKKSYQLPKYVTYISTIMLLWLLFVNAADWVVGTASFAIFFTTLLLVIILMLLVLYLAREFKTSLMSKLHLQGKNVYTEVGGLIGRALGVNRSKGTLVIATDSDQKFDVPLELVADLEDKIILKY